MMPSQPSFCTPGKSREELVGDVLAEAGLAERARRESRASRVRSTRRAVGVEPRELERRDRARRGSCRGCGRVRVDLEPFGIGRHHPPRHEVVERRAPQHRLLAAGVHRDVAADARRVGGRRIDREHEACALPPPPSRAASRRRRRSRSSRPASARPGSAMRSTAERRSSFSVLMTAERGVERASRRRCSRCRRRAG